MPKTLVASPSAENILRVNNEVDVKDKKGSVPPEEDVCIRLWMPVLFGLHDVIMTSELEVRTKALSYLFDSLKAQGHSFPVSFWDLLSKGVLFPIFDDMKQSSSNTNSLNSKFANKEELSIWLSTTLIQALRQFVDLFTMYYQKIGYLLPNMFSLMKSCLLHENEALSRIGSTCIQQLVELNAHHFNDQSWNQLGNLFTELNDETAPTFLFFNYREGGK
jgi:brefeldin A-inhibited guanine nucleotide-exchange protein